MSYLRIKKHYIHVPYLVLGTIEAALIFIASVVILSLKQNPDSAAPSTLAVMASGVVVAGVMMCCHIAMGVYNALLRESFGNIILRTFVSCFLLASPCLYLLNFITHGWLGSPDAILYVIALCTLLAIAGRWLFIKCVDATSLKRRVLFYGAGMRAQGLLNELAPHMEATGIAIVGCIPSANETVQVSALPIIQEPSDWLAYVKSQRITEIVIVPDDRRQSSQREFPFEALLDCKLAGVESTEALAFSERELGFVDLTVLKPAWLLFSDGFTHAPFSLLAQRTLDYVLATLCLIIFWPLMLLTALAVRLDSQGPILYSQVRVGLNGKAFRIYKFRSMRVDAEKNGAVWASKHDSRITRVGSFIRNTRLDELPQLYNIFKGDMSFVGPRPERPEFVETLKQSIPYYDLRHKVKPGLIGWAQLNYPYGWTELDAKNKLQYDLYYVKNHSIFMDIIILIQTVEVILLGKGAH